MVIDEIWRLNGNKHSQDNACANDRSQVSGMSKWIHRKASSWEWECKKSCWFGKEDNELEYKHRIWDFCMKFKYNLRYENKARKYPWFSFFPKLRSLSKVSLIKKKKSYSFHHLYNFDRTLSYHNLSSSSLFSNCLSLLSCPFSIKHLERSFKMQIALFHTLSLSL